MTTPGVYLNTVQATAAINDPHQKLALQEGHDADIPSSIPADLETGKAISENLTTADGKDKELGSDGASIKSEGLVTDEEKAETSKDKSPVDPNEVYWDGDDDPANPMNWSTKRKWAGLAVLSFITFITSVFYRCIETY
jgi:hypothetical protein